MSLDDRTQVTYIVNWVTKILMGVLATLAYVTFTDIRDSIKEQRVESMQFSREIKAEVKSVNERLIRVEASLENKPK